jgi:coatomer subunit beta
VSSTETSHIFGTIVFDNSSTAQKTFVNLNDIQLDIMDYIRPAECKNENFRSMWAEFEWENKVRYGAVDLGAYLITTVVGKLVTFPVLKSRRTIFILASHFNNK